MSDRVIVKPKSEEQKEMITRIRDGLHAGKQVKVTGLGIFEAVTFKKQTVIDPIKKMKHLLPERRVVRFRSTKSLKGYLNGK